ncbi:uncharacterized protein LOC130744247 [Lotus japonicus]|uniref:uncharacterized protein LOC130744247 n=1 Tax=Lotus japonicus TaxID=34305 RepID=UPI00258792C6|nr:uncharacterized protein LOC130744247 [Lotus japonicus]
MPKKRRDPGSFTIPVEIEGLTVVEALCDLGASINLMPLSMFKRLNLGEVTPTMISLQMADRSLKTPYGIIEDVVVKVDKFVFPVDFIILDMEEDSKVPLILGRPFLATGEAEIKVAKGTLTLRVGEDEVLFNIFDSLKHRADDEVFRCEVVDELVCEEFVRISIKDPLETTIMEGLEIEDQNLESELDSLYHVVNATLSQLESVSSLATKSIWKEELIRDEEIQIDEKSELKPLPSSLKYAYLEEGENKPVILSSALTPLEEEKLLRVLRDHKSALGWTIDDIKVKFMPCKPCFDVLLLSNACMSRSHATLLILDHVMLVFNMTIVNI